MKFKTKQTNKKMEFNTGMQREISAGKPRYDLIIPLGEKNHLLRRWADLMARGAEKYSARNWEVASTQVELDRFRESAFRHFMSVMDGDIDEDHYAAVCFNLQGMLLVQSRLLSSLDK